MRVGLVGCVKQKGKTPAPARSLYVSPLFKGRRAYVERTCDRWFILSALHGVVDPESVIAPYDVTLNGLGVGRRRSWSAEVVTVLEQRLGTLAGIDFEMHAGANYCDWGLVDGLRTRGGSVTNLTTGLSMGLQLRFYKQARAAATRVSPSDPR